MDDSVKDLIESSRPPAGARVARNAFHLVLGQASTTVLAFLLNGLLGRWLGVTDYGLFFLVTSMGLFAYVIVDWGQAQYVIREVAQHPEQAGQLLGSMLMLRIVGGFGLSALTALAVWLLGYDARTVGFAALMVVAMLPFVLAQGYGIVFRGRERMELDSIVSVLNKALTLGATLLLLALGTGLLGAIVSQALGGLCAVAAAALLLRRADVPPLRASVDEARRLLQGGTPLLMVGLAVAAQSYLEVIVLSKLAPSESVGWFGAARTVFGTLIAPASILAMAAYPGMARAAHSPQLLTREVQVSTRPLVALAVL
ncbi:MAG TPA: oligosaccharide flippase family protein, partial [Polyangiaceae bacterium]